MSTYQKLDNLNRSRDTIEKMYVQLESSLQFGGIDGVSKNIMDTITSHVCKTNDIPLNQVSLEHHSSYDTTKMSMEATSNLLSSLGEKVIATTKAIWAKIIGFFKKAYNFFRGDKDKVESVEKELDVLNKTINSNNDNVNVLINDKVKNPADSRSLQNHISSTLKQNRYTIEQREALVEYVTENHKNLFEEYVVDNFCAKIEENKLNWTIDRALLEMSYLNHNFSIKRLRAIMAMFRYARDNGDERVPLVRGGMVSTLRGLTSSINNLDSAGKVNAKKILDKSIMDGKVSVKFAQGFGPLAGKDSTVITQALATALEYNHASKIRGIAIIDKLITASSENRYGDNSDEQVSQNRKLNIISDDIRTYLTDTLAIKKLSIPGMNITLPDGDKDMLNATDVKVSFTVPDMGEGSIAVLSLPQITRLNKIRFDSFNQIEHVNKKFLAKIEKMSNAYNKLSTPDKVDNWCNSWATKITNTTLACDKYVRYVSHLYELLAAESINNINTQVAAQQKR